ncbi:hypothetical protein [Paenibacillus validus]|uniref:DUF624 domain-containing protein n=1 Tax=Paenibacillus validus TaxID=44253 RepID=A0A7X2Z8D5_9BACL|nr:hypothetical protein [Paenibacillus validus]MUG70203.1 hypothetical protein [Paenibacillus validus]
MRSLSQLIVQAGGLVYREMIAVFLFSAVSSAVLMPLVFLFSAGTALLLVPVVYAPLLAGVFYAAHRMVAGERPRLKDVFAGAVRFFIPSAVFGLLCSLFVLILASTWWYYGQKDGMLHWALAIFQTYFVTMFFVSQLYTLPLIVQENEPVFRAVGRSVKLTVTHPGYTIGAFLQLLCVTVLLGLTVVGFAFLFAGMAAVYSNMVARNVLAGREEKAENQGGKTWGGIAG